MGVLLLRLCLRQFADLIRCHTNLHDVTHAVDFPIGNFNQMAAEPQKTANFHADAGLAAGRRYALNGAKAVSIGGLGIKPHQIASNSWCRSSLLEQAVLVWSPAVRPGVHVGSGLVAAGGVCGDGGVDGVCAIAVTIGTNARTPAVVAIRPSLMTDIVFSFSL